MLRLPLPNPMLSGSSGGVGGKPRRHIDIPICWIGTDQGQRGVGFGWTLMGGGTAVSHFLQHDIAPLLMEREVHVHAIVQDLTLKLQSMARSGIGRQAIGCVDTALWDILGQKAGMPVWQLLGGHARGGAGLRIGRRLALHVAGGDRLRCERLSRTRHVRHQDEGRSCRRAGGCRPGRDDPERTARWHLACGRRQSAMDLRASALCERLPLPNWASPGSRNR